EVVRSDQMDERDLLATDQMVCAYNRTRVLLNRSARRLLGRPKRPVVGDRVMCLQNDRELGVFNGMQGEVSGLPSEDASEAGGAGEMAWYGEGDGYVVPFDHTPFTRERQRGWRLRDRESGPPFDYAYAVTCHKAQGDEWGHVTVFDEGGGSWDRVRWAY